MKRPLGGEDNTNRMVWSFLNYPSLAIKSQVHNKSTLDGYNVVVSGVLWWFLVEVKTGLNCCPVLYYEAYQ